MKGVQSARPGATFENEGKRLNDTRLPSAELLLRHTDNPTRTIGHTTKPQLHLLELSQLDTGNLRMGYYKGGLPPDVSSDAWAGLPFA